MSPSLFSSKTLFKNHQGSWMLPQFLWMHVWTHVCINLVCFEGFFLCPLGLLFLMLFPLPVLHGSLSQIGRDLMETFQDKPWSVPRFLHNVCLWVSVFVPNCCRAKLHWWQLSKALIYEYRRMSYGVILSLWICVVIFYLCFNKAYMKIRVKNMPH